MLKKKRWEHLRLLESEVQCRWKGEVTKKWMKRLEVKKKQGAVTQLLASSSSSSSSLRLIELADLTE